jgi:hypothetical protein
MPDSLESITYPIHEKLLLLDTELRVIDASPAYYRAFNVTPAETLNRQLGELGDRQWNIPSLRKSLNELLPADGEFEAFEVTHDFPILGRKTMLLSAHRLSDSADGVEAIMLAIDELTGDPIADAELLPSGILFEMDAPIP